MIRKEGSEYFVYNHNGTKKLSKGYGSKKEAEKRLQQIEYFKYNDADEKIVKRIMKEFEEGKLRSGSGELVTSRKQAEAIALSEARANE